MPPVGQSVYQTIYLHICKDSSFLMVSILYFFYSITVMFFAKEDQDCNLIVTKESLLKSVTVPFQQGLGQKFRQPSGTGIDFSIFEETELIRGAEREVYPLVLKAEACPQTNEKHECDGNSSGNSQITQAVFEKDKGEYQVRVIKQILWVNKTRYELQEIYGIGNAVDDLSGNDSGKECVVCLSEPRDTTVLPCRHMVCKTLLPCSSSSYSFVMNKHEADSSYNFIIVLIIYHYPRNKETILQNLINSLLRLSKEVQWLNLVWFS